MTKLRARIVVTFVLVSVFDSSGAVAQTAQDPARIDVDLRDAAKYVFHAKISLPVKPGPMTLVYPKWIPGDHSPVGPIFDLTGLKISAGGKEVAWRRDDEDMFSFHVDVPGGANRLEIKLDYLSPAEATGTREHPATTAQLAVLNWYVVMLYPQERSRTTCGVASLRLPAGWKYGIGAAGFQRGGEIEFAPATLTTVIDSPALPGRFSLILICRRDKSCSTRCTLRRMAGGAGSQRGEVQHLRH